jgi:hypothetical protein
VCGALEQQRGSISRQAMSPAIYPALFFTVALLVTTACFLVGGLPLLILEHDTALDTRFIRGFFNLCYKSAFWAAAGAAVSFLPS